MPTNQSVSLAGTCVLVHLKCLRWCGFCRLPPTTRRVIRDRHEAYRLFALAVTGTYLAQEVVYAYQSRSDMEKFSQVIFLLLCHVTSIVKQVVFFTAAARIDHIIAGLDVPLHYWRLAVSLANLVLFFASRNSSATLLMPVHSRIFRSQDFHPAFQGHTPASRNVLRERTVVARRLQRVYAGSAVFTCTLWLASLSAEYVLTDTVEFPFWVPKLVDQHLPIPVLLAYSYYATTLAAIGNTTMDSLIGALMDQYTAQLRILRMDLQSLSDEARAETEKNESLLYEDVVLQLLYQRLDHYNKICTGARSVERVFGGATFVQFAIGGWILCMAAYKLIGLQVFSVQFASMMLFILCILLELLIYCYFGNQLTYESMRVQEALFSCGWETWPRTAKAARRALLLARERARRPLRTIAGGVVPLSLETYIKILKSSYTFYAVLRQTK